MVDRDRLLTETAFIWQAEGIPVVPCLPRSKECRLHWRAYEASPARNELLRFWFRNGAANLAVVCGVDHNDTQGRGLVVLDFDNLDNWRSWQTIAGGLAKTYTETSGRGVHAFYKVDRPEKRVFDLCEVLGLGHLCLVYPSVHPSGRPYQVMGDPCEPIRQTETDRLYSLLSKGNVDRDRPGQENPGSGTSDITRLNDCRQVTGRCDAAGSPGGRLVTGQSDGAANRQAWPVTPSTSTSSHRGDLVDQLKASYPILTYAQELTSLKPSRAGGRWFIGRCPFHEDAHPSLWVDAERGTWGCYSTSCKAHQGGDVINLFALAHGLTVNQAIRLMGEKIHAGQ